MSAEMQSSEMTAPTLPAPDTGRDADVADHKTAGLLDYLSFPPSGRLKRLTFCTAVLGLNLTYTSIFCFLATLLLVHGQKWPVMLGKGWTCFSIILMVANIRLSIQRCRDIGLTPWLIVPFFYPFLISYISVAQGLLEVRFLRVHPWPLAGIAFTSGIFLLWLLICPSKTEKAPSGNWAMFLASIFFPPLLFVLLLVMLFAVAGALSI
jgi:uncharacterized membrane protein YhaH (DUF805 family)